jgi:tellurite resistance protein TehA-like permease
MYIQGARLRIRKAANDLWPEAGAAVMATGIVSVALHSLGQEALSRGLLVVTAILWIALAVAFLWRLPLQDARSRRDTGGLSSLTAVAGTAVLGSRLILLGWYGAGWALLGISTILWMRLLTLVRAASARPSTGTGFLAVVAPQSQVALAGQLAHHQHLLWLVLSSLIVFVIGLAVYMAVIAAFDFRVLRTGAGDHWVAGGALAISALSCAELVEADAAVRALGGAHGVLRLASRVLWVLAIVWLPVLIGSELRWPRLTYDVHRWATVFPLGMYAAMSFAIARVSDDGWIASFARTWTWIALGAWAIVAIGALRRLASVAQQAPEPRARER